MVLFFKNMGTVGTVETSSQMQSPSLSMPRPTAYLKKLGELHVQCTCTFLPVPDGHNTVYQKDVPTLLYAGEQAVKYEASCSILVRSPPHTPHTDVCQHYKNF